MTATTYVYNGRGDRIEQWADMQRTRYTLDLASPLTQVLADETNTYLYGNDRLAQQSSGEMEYFLTDALGSMRQLANDTSIILAKEYKPYGEVLREEGSGSSYFGFTGEWTSPYNEFMYLRSRWYDVWRGRFITRDTWAGNASLPMSYNKWLYTNGNPINYSDPLGMFSREQIARSFGKSSFEDVVAYYRNNGEQWGFLATLLRALPGDQLSSGRVSLTPWDHPGIFKQKYTIGYNATSGITFDNIPLSASITSSRSNPTLGEPGLDLWRSSNATHFTLSDGIDIEHYVNGSDYSDLPDVWGISFTLGPTFPGASFGADVMYLRDRYGNDYLATGPFLSAGPLDFELSYIEMYVQNWHGFRLNETELRGGLSGLGLCGTIQISLGLGIAGGWCQNLLSFSIYSIGLQASYQASSTIYTIDLGKNENMGWQWVLDDISNGLYENGLNAVEEVPYWECQTYVPLISR